MASTVVGISSHPEMTIIGTSARSRAICFCSSRPFRSRRQRARIKQLGSRGRGRARNSRTDSNVSNCQPWRLISDFSDSCSEMSSVIRKNLWVGTENQGLYTNACASRENCMTHCCRVFRGSPFNFRRRAAKPNCLTRSGSDSRIDLSSSTTETSGRSGAQPWSDSISPECAALPESVHCTLVLVSRRYEDWRSLYAAPGSVAVVP